jgi:hypothetical protein
MPCCWRRSRRLANKHVLTGGANLGEFRLNCARCYWNRCRNIASLTMSAVSSTFRAQFSEHSEKSAISLSLTVCLFQPRLARNPFRSGTQSDPCISSVATAIMITTSNSSF